MPANLTPQYLEAEKAFRQATTTEEKVERLEEMIALLPKHKGTDHLFGDLKRRLARLKKHEEQQRKRGRRGPALEFVKEGAAQLILTGPPNSGKSSLLAAFTKAAPAIADYPFTTRAPQPGMLPYEDIQFQIIDCPPMTADHVPMHVSGLLRGCELALLVADLSADTLLDDVEAVLAALAARSIELTGDAQTRSDTPRAAVRTLCLANKLDAPDAEDRLALLRRMYAKSFPFYPLSCRDGRGIAELPGYLFSFLNVVRVYTKAPGKKPDHSHPFTVFGGDTVEDVCARVHKDFVADLKFARLWRGKADPITVSRREPLQDADILELHV